MSTVAIELENTDSPKELAGKTATEPCANCETSVAQGAFCTNCGQENRDKIVPLKEFILDMVDEFFSIDTKITRSLKPLLLKPGFLTKEYISGRRVNYLLPSRMYFIISVVFFFLVQHFDPVGVQSSQTYLAERGIDYTNPAVAEKFNTEAADTLPMFLLSAIPLFALFLKMLYFRSKRFFVEHLIFSFHFFSVMLIGIVPTLFFKTEIIQLILELMALCVFPITYLFIAFKRVYEQGIAKTVVKTGIAWVVFVLSIYFAISFMERWAAAGL